MYNPIAHILYIDGYTL